MARRNAVMWKEGGENILDEIRKGKEEFSHEELAKLIGEEVKSPRYRAGINLAITFLRDKHNVILSSVRGKGYQALSDRERLEYARTTLNERIGNAVERQTKVLATIEATSLNDAEFASLGRLVKRNEAIMTSVHMKGLPLSTMRQDSLTGKIDDAEGENN